MGSVRFIIFIKAELNGVLEIVIKNRVYELY